MINHKIKLIRPGLFLPSFSPEKGSEERVIVQPTVLSICAADQRYFNGSRPAHVLKAKLPMCLIHEAIGKVVHDPSGRLSAGQNVVLLPNGGLDSLEENYSSCSFFRSSTADGFTQEFVGLEFGEILPFDSPTPKYYVFCELISVCFQAISQIPEEDWVNIKTVGIWGDGPVGYLLSLCLKKEFPFLKIIVFGKHEEKLILFSHVEETRVIREPHLNPSYIDIAFEAVGGEKVEDALDQIFQKVRPRGFVCLTGVSESPIPVRTRTILEKGLTLRGTTRSLKRDFLRAKALLDGLEDYSILDKIISNEFRISSSDELTQAFYQDQKSPFKTLLIWDI